MRRGRIVGLVVVAASACSQFYDITDTRLDDDDEAPENPVCPGAGEGAPQFRSDVREVLARECFSYTVSTDADRAFATCLVEGAGSTFEEGPIDAPLTVATVAVQPADWSIQKPWLAPEGNALVLHQHSPTGGTGLPTVHRISLYTRNGSTWTWSSDIVETTDFITAGVPSAGPQRRQFESRFAGWRELEQQGTSWVEVHRGTWAQLGLTSGIGDNLNLSPDGLRLTFTESFDVYYVVRPSLSEPFGAAVRITTVGQARDAFLVADCERIYFTGLSNVFYRYLQ